MPRRDALSFALILAIPFCLAATANDALRIDDIVSLLKAGVGEKVILKQIESTRTRLTVTVEAMLQLKAAGASDAFLEALMGASSDGDDRESATQPASAEPSFRMYTETMADGETILHITNLDANGRRIGGEVEPSPQRNVVQAPDYPPAPEPVPYEYDEEPQPPVVVNVYPPAPSEPSGYSTGAYVSPYAGGLYTGYGAFYGYTPSYHAHGPHCGHHVGPYYSPYAPPGSYSHFVQYHHSNGTRYQSSIPSVIDTTPYRYGNAHFRNRVAFRRR